MMSRNSGSASRSQLISLVVRMVHMNMLMFSQPSDTARNER
jgi:hypothetical protein